MSEPPGEYYTEERWHNWLQRVESEELDPEDEDSARLLLNLQDDTAIAVAKILTDENGEVEEETALGKLEEIEEVVLAEQEFDSEETAMLIDGVQTSLMCVFYTAQEYVVGGPAEDGTVPGYIEAAAEAEAEEDMEAALGYCVQAGTLVIDGEELDRELADELDFGLVAEWVNGLDSLQTALADPEVVEEDDGED